MGEKLNNHGAADSETALLSQVGVRVDNKLTTELQSAKSNELWHICTCMSLAVLAIAFCKIVGMRFVSVGLAIALETEDAIGSSTVQHDHVL